MSPKEKPKLPVAIYTRVSEQGRRSDEELLSHDLQRAKVGAYLEAVDIVASTKKFEETSVSGGKMSRPVFDEVIEGIRAGKLGGIAVARLSRFARTVREALELIDEIEAVGGTVIAVDVKLDTSTAIGRAILTVLLAFNTLEREQAIEQAALTAEHKLRKGETLGGAPPLGYRFEIVGWDTNGKDLRGWLVRDEPAASVVAEAALKFDRRELATVGRVADFLNQHDLRTRPTKRHPKGKPWNISNTKALLQRKVYTGTRTYGDLEFEDAHEALIPADVWRRIQRRLEPKEAGVTRTRGEGHVLGNGLVRCGGCGGGLSKSVANGSYVTLRCNSRGRGHAAVMYEAAEEHVVSVAFARTGFAGYAEGGNADEIRAADRRLESAREELAEVEELRAAGVLKPAALAVALSDAQTAVEQAEDARAALEPQGGTMRLLFPAGKRELYERLEVAEKRAALRSIVKQVVVEPGRTSLPELRGKVSRDVYAAAVISERLTIEFQDGEYHPADRAPGYVPKIPVLTGQKAAA